MSLDPSSGILTLLSASTLHGSSLAAYINSTVSILFRQSIENYLIGPSDPNFLDKLAYVSPPFFSTAPSPADPWRPLFYFNMTDSTRVVYSSLNFVDGTPYRDVNAALKRYSVLSPALCVSCVVLCRDETHAVNTLIPPFLQSTILLLSPPPRSLSTASAKSLFSSTFGTSPSVFVLDYPADFINVTSATILIPPPPPPPNLNGPLPPPSSPSPPPRAPAAPPSSQSWQESTPEGAFTTILTLDPSSVMLSINTSDPKNYANAIPYVNLTFAVAFPTGIDDYLSGMNVPSYKDKLLYVARPFWYLGPTPPTGQWRPCFYVNGSNVVVFSSLNFMNGTPSSEIYFALQR